MSKLKKQLQEEHEDIKARAYGVKIVDREVFRDRIQNNRIPTLFAALLCTIVGILVGVLYTYSHLGLL